MKGVPPCQSFSAAEGVLETYSINDTRGHCFGITHNILEPIILKA